MTTAFEIKPDKLIKAVAIDLKDNVKIPKPDWSDTVKTGSNKERAPDDPNWWWMRTASILRKIYIGGPVGASKLRVEYGSAKNRGRRPEQFRKAGGKVIRTILQQLDEAGFTEKDTNKFRGRKLTPKGCSYLDKIASKLEKTDNV
ncbi:MAG: 30S ribosomal protein S19e [Methanobacteriota archaeon]